MVPEGGYRGISSRGLGKRSNRPYKSLVGNYSLIFSVCAGDRGLRLWSDYCVIVFSTCRLGYKCLGAILRELGACGVAIEGELLYSVLIGLHRL